MLFMSRLSHLKLCEWPKRSALAVIREQFLRGNSIKQLVQSPFTDRLRSVVGCKVMAFQFHAHWRCSSFDLPTKSRRAGVVRDNDVVILRCRLSTHESS
jgi:hypothetical protein